MGNKRIIPCLDVDKGRVVKGKRFQNIEDVADPLELAKKYVQDGADELVFYDITASTENRSLFLDAVEKIAKEVPIPFTVGGGIRTLQDIQNVLDAGADKVSINSIAVEDPSIIQQASEKFGSDKIILSMDVQKVGPSKWSIFVRGGNKDTGMDAIEWAVRGEQLGAGELVVNSIDGDGVKDGYDVELLRTIAEAVNIPIVASGGAGTKEHFVTVLTEGKSDAALAASVFHYGEINITELKKYLQSENIPIKE
ncbi:imidazole glycerol phosphate synthase subunit HisF [Sporosarcina sp. G11-34]|uniref:imidazole glycerol phosphate synthase subunit HisF n=1 Tax=Sporosarcina sp. G11-34 TaxID=2849605 RepID=UPI0022A9F30B|nr:imidazole glycerol phosphate synthase subunit HisF [Sporosarcina sp. G11-34]MCZ2257844.1 imidazole glycerol phosphate synthase subunit HisF [Sporosarcina sp. G11-34]